MPDCKIRLQESIRFRVVVVKNMYKLEEMVSVKELWRRIAMLGGFLGRRLDGDPGWQTIWKGWLRIQDMHAGMALAKNYG